MQEIAKFFLPRVGSGLVRALAVVFNLGCILAGVLLLGHLGWTAVRRLRTKRDERLGRPSRNALLLSSALAACGVIFLAWLPYGAAGWDGSAPAGITNDWVFLVLLDALDPVLMLRNLTGYPTPFFGLNLILRALVVWLLGAAVLFVWRRVRSLWGAVRRFWDSRRLAPKEQGPLTRTAWALLRQTGAQVLALLSLIPFTLRHLVEAAKSFLSVMLQIFVGYSTESDKNRAVFVAACFASIASLLNTFFGLTGFYSSDSSPIPVICSFAIACAVQLAMLIFGMKAGEGIAEKMLLEQRFHRGGLLRAMVEKVFCCLLYVLGYAAFLILLYGGVFSEENGAAIVKSIPALLTAFGTLLFAYAVVRQGMDIWRLYKAFRAAKGEEGELPLPIAPDRKPRRLPGRFYLAAYLLLMVVSTGFAFNNMFGYYANSAKLHERVYDQVRYETEDRLRLGETVNSMAQTYAEGTNAILLALEDGAASATAKRQDIRTDYDTQAGRARDNGNASLAANLENIRDRYVARTNDFETTVSVIKSFLQMDYDDIGGDVVITTEEYAHYWKQRAQESYRTSFFSFALPGSTITVGTQVTEGVTRSITTAAGETIRFPQDRHPDPDSIDQSIIRTVRAIPNGDKYVVLRTLLSQYERLENEIYTTGKPATDMDRIYDLLDKNAEIDGIRGSVAALYAGEGGTAKVSVMDLPRVLDAYLNSGGAVSTVNAPKGKEDLSKYAAYESLSAYVDRALELNDLLSGYNEEGGSQGAYLAQQFRNYAQGITWSDFQISYDALLHGSLGINPAKSEGITALYSASPIAWFLLLICTLVDFSAFFAGLLLFKDIYLFERNSKIEEVGYLNYEAALTSFFTPPEVGPERTFHLAFLYQLLHGGTGEEEPEAEEPRPEEAETEENGPETEGAEPDEAGQEEASEPSEPVPEESPEAKAPDTRRLQAILDSAAFRAFRQSGEAALGALGIRADREDASFADLQVWLTSFVKKNGITFDELFQEDKPDGIV